MASENLYLIKRSYVDLKDPNETYFKVAILGAYTNLHTAKTAAKTILMTEGYDQSDFPKYEVNNGQDDWAHGDGVIVYAEGPSGEKFTVTIETVPNTVGLEGDQDGKVSQQLWHVLQMDVDYVSDRSGFKRETFIEGSYMNYEDAKIRALKVLLDPDLDKKDYAEYTEYTDGTESPYGPDVIVHAAKENGEVYLVMVIASA